MKRRSFLAAALSAATVHAANSLQLPASTAGRLHQGVTRQVFGNRSLDDCCRLASSLGVRGFDFVGDPKDWPTLRRYGMTMSMYRVDFGGGISMGRSPEGPPGWHAIGMQEAQGDYLKSVLEGIDIAAREGFPNLIVLAGSKGHMTYEEGAQNAVTFLSQARTKAEQRGVTICMELLNSKGIAAPPQSLFDHAEWGFNVVSRVNSPRVKVLYDIWHAQLMDGDIVNTIRKNIDRIGHFHTGGVPDRHELFRNNELDYRFIGRTIADLDFQGFVTHEWSPSAESEAETDLRRSVELMTV